MRNSTRLILVLVFLVSNTIFFIIGTLQRQTKLSTSDEVIADNLVEKSPFVGVNVGADSRASLSATNLPQSKRVISAESQPNDVSSMKLTTQNQSSPIKEFKTGFPGFQDKNQVLCGGHTAPNCSSCPQGNGRPWCNGECEWIANECIRSSKLKHIHPDYFKIIERYAFQPVMNERREYVNIILVRAPFRGEDDEALYKFYKDDILFLGISSFESFPLKSCNPHSSKYESEYYLNMFPGFLHMMHEPEDHFPEGVKTVLMSQSDFMLDDAIRFGELNNGVEKIYDFVYSGGDQVRLSSFKA